MSAVLNILAQQHNMIPTLLSLDQTQALNGLVVLKIIVINNHERHVLIRKITLYFSLYMVLMEQQSLIKMISQDSVSVLTAQTATQVLSKLARTVFLNGVATVML
jgi:hypothetical protein